LQGIVPVMLGDSGPFAGEYYHSLSSSSLDLADLATASSHDANLVDESLSHSGASVALALS